MSMKHYLICLCVLIFICTLSFVILSYHERLHLMLDFRRKGHQKRNFSKPDGQVVNTGPTRVLVLTYMRSGSTIIGDILQHHGNSTYAFEPLRFIEEYVRTGKGVDYLNGTRRNYDKKNSSWVLVDMLYRWFTCDITRINIMDLTSSMIHASNTYSNYYQCVNAKKGVVHASMMQRRKCIYQCMKLLKEPCDSGRVVIVKTIRLDMASVDLLLTLLPGLKVIHLLRDPRGKLSSELNLDTRGWSSLSSRANSVCHQIQSDIMETYGLYKAHPYSIRILQYEHFSNDTIEKTKNIFRYLNLTFTTEMLRHVKRLTLQKKLRNDCVWCAKETNAKLTSLKWRLDMDYKNVEQIDQNCKDLYRTVGYVPMNDTSSLRNLSIPAQVDTWIHHMSL